MEIAERIDYLVKELAGDNGREFAKRTGMPESSVSKWRNGVRKPNRAAMDKILASYPEIRREWLIDGNGRPFTGRRIPKDIASEIMERLDKIEETAEKIVSMLEKFA